MRTVPLTICVVLLASCARGGGYSPLPAALPNGMSPLHERAPAGNGYKVLYSFEGGSDAGNPYAGLTNLNGTFYGTTYGGGGGSFWGTVYKVSTSGEEHVLYRFQAGHDGAHPYDDLTAVGGTLYGTTQQGGTSGNGTVFKVSPSGEEHVIYSFKGGSDGQYPYSRLLDVNGTLYGTTQTGGAEYGWGVVFKISTSGEENVLYRFKANNDGTHDGAHPYAGVIDLNGTLYGTTQEGGASGNGTVYKISTDGVEHVIYSFKGGTDGQYPFAKLTALNGQLYGTTETGGGGIGWGVVFKVSVTGDEHVLYRFKGGHDGAHPEYGGLITVGGDALYGTTYQGGASGAGTVFKVTTAGVEQVLYSFKGGTDGQYPYAGLTNLNGTLFSTTYQGGASGTGTVFKLSS
jgi:uncharacterized repeat protein (TIGR03803 family)